MRCTSAVIVIAATSGSRTLSDTVVVTAHEGLDLRAHFGVRCRDRRPLNEHRGVLLEYPTPLAQPPIQVVEADLVGAQRTDPAGHPEQRATALVEQFQEDLVLAVEVLIERGARNACGLRDGIDRRVEVAETAEQLERHLGDPGSRAGAAGTNLRAGGAVAGAADDGRFGHGATSLWPTGTARAVRCRVSRDDEIGRAGDSDTARLPGGRQVH